MGSENGRSLTADLARYRAGEKRELDEGDKQAAADTQEGNRAKAELQRMKEVLAETYLQGQPPPEPAVGLQRVLAQTTQRIEAWRTLRPAKVNALKGRQAEWLEKNGPAIRERN